MYEKELMNIQKKIVETVKESASNPEGAVEKLLALQKEATGFVTDSSAEYYNVSVAIYEATGDIWLKAKRPADAEKAYVEMQKSAQKLYEMDKEKFDYRLGVSYYKRAAFYRALLQCDKLVQKPKVLDERQKKVFTLCEGLYKNAITVTMENARKGQLRYVDLHLLCLSDLLVLFAAVGAYDRAVLCGKDSVKLDKAVYEKMDDKAHSFRLANRMNALATVYTFAKNIQLAMETLEDAIFVLEEHESEDPVTFGVMLARNYLSLGLSYSQIEEEKENAEETIKKGVSRMIAVNEQTKNRLINDVITSYMVVGDYYKRVKNEDTAKVHYRWAMKLASELFEKTKNPMYENIMNRLRPVI